MNLLDPFSRATRIGCVLAAIERVNRATKRWSDLEADPHSLAMDRHYALEALKREQYDFYLQIENVEYLYNEREELRAALHPFAAAYCSHLESLDPDRPTRPPERNLALDIEIQDWETAERLMR